MSTHPLPGKANVVFGVPVSLMGSYLFLGRLIVVPARFGFWCVGWGVVFLRGVWFDFALFVCLFLVLILDHDDAEAVF